MSRIKKTFFGNRVEVDITYREGARSAEATIYPRDADVFADFGLVRLVGGVPAVPDKRTRNSHRDGGARHGDAAVAIIAAVSATDVHPAADLGGFEREPDEVDPWPRGGRGTGFY